MTILVCPNCDIQYVNEALLNCIDCGDLLVLPSLPKCKQCQQFLLSSWRACGNCGTVVPGKVVALKRVPEEIDVEGNLVIRVPKNTPLGLLAGVRRIAQLRAKKTK